MQPPLLLNLHWTILCSNVQQIHLCHAGKPGRHERSPVLLSIRGHSLETDPIVNVCTRMACLPWHSRELGHYTHWSSVLTRAPEVELSCQGMGVLLADPGHSPVTTPINHHFQVMHLNWTSSEHLPQKHTYPALSNYWRFPRLIYFWSKVEFSALISYH